MTVSYRAPGIMHSHEPLHILLVEDNPADARLLQEGLRDADATDVTIDFADRLGDALEKLGSRPYDLVLLDLSLPDARGLTTFTRVHEAYPELPVVVLTGLTDDSVALRAVREGAQDFLVKGQVDGTRLVQAMRYAVERQRLLEKTRTSTQVGEPVTRTQVVGNAHRQDRQTIAGYRVLRVLGEGSMATVYLARREEEDGHQPEVALKVMKLESLSSKNREALLERFFREAEVAASVKHESIVAIVEFGMAPDRQAPYIVMEHVSGNTLQHYLRDPDQLDYQDKAYILRQVADALAAIHDHGICHRDIKPGNIIVDEQLRVKITDFGIALVPGSELTIDLHLIGSPAYMSPEAFRSPKVNYLADVFSFGIVSYEFLLGCRPFDGETIAQLAHQIQFERPREPRKLRADFPATLQLMLARMLKKNPQQRYQDCHQIVDELKAFQQDKGKNSGALIGTLTQRLLRSDWR